MISKSLGSSFTTRIGPPIQIQKPKVTKVETLMRHEKAVFFSSFIHSFIHSLTRYLGSTHHVLSTWDTPENEIIHYTIYWKVWVLFTRSKVGGGAGSWGVVWCCAILNRVVRVSFIQKATCEQRLEGSTEVTGAMQIPRAWVLNFGIQQHHLGSWLKPQIAGPHLQFLIQ